jgi:hypothetical protein
MGMANPRIVRLTTTRPSKSRPAPDPSPTTHPARRSPGALTHAHLTNRRPYQSSCPVRTTGRPSRIRVRSRERGRVPARATRRPRYGSARSSSARAAQCVGARPVGHVRACQEERANVLDIRRSWLVCVAIPGRPRAGSLRGLGGRHRYRAARGSPDRGALGRARAAGRRSQTGTAHGLSGSAGSRRSRPCQSRAHVPQATLR